VIPPYADLDMCKVQLHAYLLAYLMTKSCSKFLVLLLYSRDDVQLVGLRLAQLPLEIANPSFEKKKQLCAVQSLALLG
jgi:hypothetical protein